MLARRLIPLNQGSNSSGTAWPTLSNWGFEQDFTDWTDTPDGGSADWLIRTDKTDEGLKSALWPGGSGSGYRSGIASLLMNDTKGYCSEGDTVECTGRIYGSFPDDSGTIIAVRLYYYDNADAVIAYYESNQVRGQNGSESGKWYTRKVAQPAPATTSYAKFAIWATANGAGHAGADNCSWKITPGG